jgi:hypothetical protein
MEKYGQYFIAVRRDSFDGREFVETGTLSCTLDGSKYRCQCTAKDNPNYDKGNPVVYFVRVNLIEAKWDKWDGMTREAHEQTRFVGVF